MTETHHTFCRICESLCGLEVTVDDGRITKIRPDEDHVASGGFACIKGIKQHQFYDSPDRLLYPQRRNGDGWERVSWGRAQGDIGARVRRIIAEHGPDSVAMYVGTAAGFSVLHPVFAQGFMDGLGSTSMYASATQDCANKFAAAREIYGFPFTQPFPDVDRTECLVIVGANPVVSKWTPGAPRRPAPPPTTCSSGPTPTCSSTWHSCTSCSPPVRSTGASWPSTPPASRTWPASCRTGPPSAPRRSRTSRRRRCGRSWPRTARPTAPRSTPRPG
jgi:hypothetical protein